MVIISYNIDELRKTHNFSVLYDAKGDLITPDILLPSAPLRYDATTIQAALDANDLEELRNISNYFFYISGIYKRFCISLASMLTYATFVEPVFVSDSLTIKEKTLLQDYYKAINFVDTLNIPKQFFHITLNLIKEGVYFGYFRENGENKTIQDLPTPYCRISKRINGRYILEFDIRYFDQNYRIEEDKEAALKMYPPEFKSYYNKYKKGTTREYWFTPNTDYTIAFRFFSEGAPFLIEVIPDIIELRDYKDFEKLRIKNELYKVLAIEMPMDKEGQPIFTPSETRELHKAMRNMLGNNSRVEVFTHFGEAQILSLDSRDSSVKDNLMKAERTVFNEAGISRMLYATEGNLSLDKAVKVLESYLFTLLPQYEEVMDHLLSLQIKNKKYEFIVNFLPITVFNQEEMTDRYKQLADYGYSKIAPALAAGMRQKSLLSTLTFENDILKMNDRMEPLQSTHTIPGGQKTTTEEPKENGRPEKEEEEKDEKTLENEETKT